jgi:TonB family protein
MASTTAGCSDYAACFQSAKAAYVSGDWQTATADFRAAAQKQPTSGEPWIWLGRILLFDGQPIQPSELSDDWNKALSLGAPLMIGACHEMTFLPCQRGDLLLSAKSIAFLASGTRAVFSASPADVTPGRVTNNIFLLSVSYNLKLAKKNYVLDPLPPESGGCRFNTVVQCPPESRAQALVLAQYIASTITKLKNGQLTLVASPTSTRPPASTPPASSNSNSSCEEAKTLSYSILANGALYKAKFIGPEGPQERLFFFDEKDKQITDPALLSQLASAVWTYDNVVSSSEVRSDSVQVSGVLGTSKALHNYSILQDLIARSMVEALEATVTDGATLSRAVPNLTVGLLKSQLLAAPKTILTLAAQRGLEESSTKYQQLIAVLPPKSASAVDASGLAQAKTLYIQARTLQLPYEALAAKLMPTKAGQLVVAALKSAVSEVTQSPLFSGSPSTAVTLAELLKLDNDLADLEKSIPAFQAYSQNLKLAINLANANNRTVANWARGAAQNCTATATASTAAGSTTVPVLSTGLAESMLVSKQEPVYPPIAKATRVSGTVEIRADVSKTGNVTDARVISGPAMLQQSALDAVKTWRYRPYFQNGEPVAFRTTINIVFTTGNKSQ